MTSQVHPEQMSVPDGKDVELKSYDGPASLDDEHIEAKPEVDAEGQLGIAVLPPIKQNKANAVNVDVSNGGTTKTKKEHEFMNIPLDNKDSKEKEVKEQKVASTNPVIGFFSIFRMSDWIDKMLMIVGVLAACIHGMTMPFTVRIFSDAVDMFVEDEKRRSMIGDGVTGITLTDVVDEVRPICEKLAVWAVVIVIAGSMHVACWKLTAERQVSRMRALLFKTILRQDCAWFTMHETGSLIVTLTNDMVHIEAGISDKVSLSVQHFAVFFVSVVMAIERSWKLTLTVLSLTPILIGALIASGMIISKSGQRETEAYSRAGSIAQEVLSSIKTVTAFNGQTKEKLRYDDCLGVSRYVGIMRGALFGGSLGVMLGCTFWIISLANYYGIKLMSEAAARGSNEYSGGEIIFVRANYCKHKIKVIMVILTGSMSLGQCLPNIEGIMAAGGSAINIYDVIDSVPIIDSSSDEGLKPETLNGNVELRDVEFSYPSRMDVQILKKLNLTISVGQTVALVGASGSGKSTICQLLLRLYDTNKGQVLIDGTDVQSYNVNWLRKHVGIVSQEPILFAMTIAENIRLAAGRDDVTDDDIVNAAKMANAHNFIMQWPDKYNTMVGERGAQMSGGQKQRIAIARALISNPKILLLDEATSALDSESEAIVQAALDQASEGRTTIIVAHRLSTIRNADVIYCMKAGVLVESGNHETLMQRKGYYYDLVTTQQSTKVKENQDLVKTKSIDEEEKVKEEDEKPSKLKLLEKQESVYSLKGKDDEIEIDTSFYMRLLRLNQSDWFYMLIGCLSASCVGASQPCFSLVYSSMMMNFASLDPINQFDSAKKFSLGVFFFAIAIAIVYMLQFWMFSIVGENLTQRLRRMVFGALLRQEVAWYDLQDNRVGVLTSRLAADATMVRGVSGTQLGLIVQAMASLLVALVISFVSGWKLALMIMCFVPFLVASGIAHGKDIQGGAVQSQRAADEGGKVNMPGKYYDVILGKCSDIALEAMSNIRTVAALTIENVFHVKYCNFFKEFERKQQISAIKSGFFYGIGQSISQFCYAATFFYGAYLIRENEMVFSNVFRVVLALIMAAMSVGRSTSFAPEVNKAKIAARNIFSLVDRKSAVDPEQTKGKRPESCIGDVTFENLYFSYPTRPEAPVLQGLNIAIKAGQKVALVGSSGCGKSTSVSLIERFYLPASGIVRIDGIDVTTLNVQWLRSQIGLVSQEPILFNTSIFENIVYGDNSRSPSMDEVITAAKGANIHSFITALPQGYETNVGESGGQLSGGQKQRIAIARVLLRDAKILLLDEATSALDTESEKQVQDALDVAQKGRTSIIIAHRLSTIKTADIIVVLKEGQVIEQGSHDELMSKKGSYYNLVMIQTGH